MGTLKEFIGDTEIDRLSKNLPVLAENAAHATLGASTAARWMACPGSINLIEQLGIDTVTQSDGSRLAPREGQCAHKVAEVALAGGIYALQLIGNEYSGVVVTEDMAQHVQLYLDHVRKVISIPGVIYWIEKKFSLASLNPPVPMFGTSDFSAYDPATRTLYVDDLKYGQGVTVEIEGNPQLKYYALGVWISLPHEYAVEKVVMTIIQPRKDHPEGFIRTVTIDAAELSQFAIELLDAARATLDPHAPLHAGDHCKFCPAKARCPELYKKAQEIAATEFDTPEIVLPVPASLSTEQFANTLRLLHVLDDWSAAIKEHAYQELLAGRSVPGFKLVERRAERKWVEDAPVPFEREPELMSPAQVEKIVGKKKFKEKFAQHTVKKSSGLKIVPEDHPSPPVLMGGAEFDLLPAGEPTDKEGDKEKNEK